MKFLFALNHPAHYYLFKFIIHILLKNGHEAKIVVKEKDVLETILKLDEISYHKLITKRKRKKNVFSVLFNGLYELIEQNFTLYNFCKSYRPDLMIGTDIAINHVGKLFKVPTIVYNEDDYEINKLFCKISYPFATAIVAPEYTSVGKYDKKKIAYNGIQKMAYLSSKYVNPR